AFATYKLRTGVPLKYFVRKCCLVRAFEMWKQPRANCLFPVAITRRKVSTITDPRLKLHLLIDHFDSLIRTSVIFMGAAALSGNLTNFFEESVASKDRMSISRSLRSWTF